MINFYEFILIAIIIGKLTSTEHFIRLHPVYIKENVQIGYVIDTNLKSYLKINDTNTNSEFAIIRIRTLNDQFSFADYIIIDSYTGILQLRKTLDYESFCELNLCNHEDKDTTCSFKIYLKAVLTDKKENFQKEIYLLLDLYIEDVNEFQPLFDQAQVNPIVFNITEEVTPLNLLIGNIARDDDCTDRFNLRYSVFIGRMDSVINGLNFTNIPKIDIQENLLFLSFNEPFDKEFVNSIEFIVSATDRNYTANVTVRINVIGINDNEPYFEQNFYRIEINENLNEDMFELIQLKAHDKDTMTSGVNCFIYLLENYNDYFSLNLSSGLLSLKQPLDYEFKKDWLLSVKAIDICLSTNNKAVATTFVQVSVQDVNDNKPQIQFYINLSPFLVDFLTSPIFDGVVYLSKDATVDTIIALVYVEDVDYELNGFIDDCYVNTTNNGNFSLETLTDESLRIYVEQNNFHKFPNLHSLKVTNKSKYYALRSNSNKFSNDTNEQVVFNLTVHVLDMGVEKQKNFKNIKIVFIDSAKNNTLIQLKPPIYSNLTYGLDLGENNQIPYVLTRLEIDSNEKTRIKLIRSNKANNTKRCSIDLFPYLKYNSYNRLVLLNYTVDRELCFEYWFSVKVTYLSDASFSLFHFKLSINDLNDNPPRFTSLNYTIYISENSTHNRVIFKFNTTDVDESPKTIYRIDDEYYTRQLRKKFYLDENNGVLILLKNTTHKAETVYKLRVKAIDECNPLLYSRTQINIVLLNKQTFAMQIIGIQNLNKHKIIIKELVRASSYVLFININKEYGVYMNIFKFKLNTNEFDYNLSLSETVQFELLNPANSIKLTKNGLVRLKLNPTPHHGHIDFTIRLNVNNLFFIDKFFKIILLSNDTISGNFIENFMKNLTIQHARQHVILLNEVDRHVKNQTNLVFDRIPLPIVYLLLTIFFIVILLIMINVVMIMFFKNKCCASSSSSSSANEYKQGNVGKKMKERNFSVDDNTGENDGNEVITEKQQQISPLMGKSSNHKDVVYYDKIDKSYNSCV